MVSSASFLFTGFSSISVGDLDRVVNGLAVAGRIVVSIPDEVLDDHVIGKRGDEVVMVEDLVGNLHGIWQRGDLVVIVDVPIGNFHGSGKVVIWSSWSKMPSGISMPSGSVVDEGV